MCNLSIIQGLWIGDRLSPLEQICIKSYLRVGHPFHLYTYGGLEGIPAGVVIKDANPIAPKWKIETFQNLANFSDYFRYMLLWRNGGYWVDLDNFCLRPYDFKTPYVFSSQRPGRELNEHEINAGVIKVPPKSPIIEFCLQQSLLMDTKTNHWSQIGPGLLMDAYHRFNLEQFLQPNYVFCPLPFFDAPGNVFGPDSGNQCVGNARSIHLWNEEARRAGIDKFGSHPGSLFEYLKRSVE